MGKVEQTLTAFTSDGFSVGSDDNFNRNSSSFIAWAWDGGDLATNSAYNQSQTWTNGTASGSSPFGSSAWAHVFDGVVPTSFAHANLAYLVGSGTFTFPSAISGRIQVYAAQGSNTAYSNNSLELSDGSTIDVTNGAGSFTLYDFGTKSNITSITVNGANTSSGVGVPGILLDGKLLVNPGLVPAGSLNSTVYNQSQTWSGYLTSSTGSFYNNQGADKAFDGDIGTQAEPSSSGGTLTFTPTSAITFNSTVEVMSGGNDRNVSFNSGTAVSTGTANTFKTVASGGGTLTTLSISKSGDWPTLKGIRIDGKILVDSGTTPPNVPTIASTVRSNSTSGFSVGEFEGTGSTGTVATGLSNIKMVILKNRSATSNWVVYHNIVDGSYDYMYLNLTNANASSNLLHAMNYDFKAGSNTDTNASGNDYLFYAFSPIAGYSAFGTYVGDASLKPFIYTGMRPKFVMIKCTNNTSYGYWFMFDTERSTFNVVSDEAALAANLNEEEGLSSWNSNGPGNNALDILSNGFKMKLNSTNGLNNTGDTYLWAAFAEHPFNNSRAR